MMAMKWLLQGLKFNYLIGPMSETALQVVTLGRIFRYIVAPRAARPLVEVLQRIDLIQ
jgi:hypothetical protein